MRNPDHVSRAYDILYTSDGSLDDDRVRAILQNYNNADWEGEYPTQIKAINYDGSLKLGAWVYCDPGIGEFDWVYIAAGDRVNRQLIAQAADQGTNDEIH